MQQTNWWWAV